MDLQRLQECKEYMMQVDLTTAKYNMIMSLPKDNLSFEERVVMTQFYGEIIETYGKAILRQNGKDWNQLKRECGHSLKSVFEKLSFFERQIFEDAVEIEYFLKNEKTIVNIDELSFREVKSISDSSNERDARFDYILSQVLGIVNVAAARYSQDSEKIYKRKGQSVLDDKFMNVMRNICEGLNNLALAFRRLTEIDIELHHTPRKRK